MPILEEINDGCEYIFSWATNVVCPEDGPQQSNNCKFTDQNTQNTFDFSSLSRPENPYEVSCNEVNCNISLSRRLRKKRLSR